ncbi:MAG: hypothetical protein GXP26_13195 [Planctomycetes bacterium]|nr:hypothetical protein [Planctomycetota bacterium]
MSIASEQARLEEELRRPFDREKYCGPDWYQVSDAETEVFGLLPEQMPTLVAVHELYFDAVDITTIHEKDRIDSLRKELPWLTQRMNDQSEWQRFAALFGISSREAHAYWSKYSFWEERMGLVTYRDEEQTEQF